MRDIRFRAWDGEKYWYSDSPTADFVFGSKGNGVYENGHLIFDLTDSNCEQYTGLKDKNGTDLYEGDKIELTYWWFDGNEAESTLTGSVVYIPDRACFGLEGVKNEEWLRHIGDTPDSSDTLAFADINYSSDDIEIVGNKYEN